MNYFSWYLLIWEARLLPHLLNHWFGSLFYRIYCWFHLMWFFNFCSCTLHFWLVPFYVFLIFIFMFPSSLSKFSLRSLSILITSVLNLASGRLHVSFCFVPFLNFWSVLSLEMFLCLLLAVSCLFQCIRYISRAATSPALGETASCSRCSVGPGSEISLVTSAGRSTGCVACVGYALLLYLSLDCC